MERLLNVVEDQRYSLFVSWRCSEDAYYLTELDLLGSEFNRIGLNGIVRLAAMQEYGGDETLVDDAMSQGYDCVTAFAVPSGQQILWVD